ncbi:MAG TPA: hypothetical protein VGQ06_05945 [Gemmatimonadales bacterium]|jgi:hypothetical protein|nr:hypothetical protein [Gemmatimonadales bacterium]
MMDRSDDRLDERLKQAAQDYNRPPETPRDAIWARIAAERQRRAARRVIELKPWARWMLAAAALLLLGIGIGRWTAGPPGPPPGTPRVATADVTDSDVAYDVVATQYLSRTEAFLTGFRADLRAGRTDTRFAGQARDLLTTTRLLLDSPAAEDQHLRVLLEDLELVLVQISQLEAGRNSPDADLITQGMDQRNVLPKLRSAIPAGPVPVRTQGVT